MWRRKGQPPRVVEVFVTQPYSYDLEKMLEFAKEQGLWFWISERPAWHFPRRVCFIEWANPASQFASLRGTREADGVDADDPHMEGRRARSRIGEGLDVNSLARAEFDAVNRA